MFLFFFFFQAEDGIRDRNVTGVQTCALPIFVKLIISALFGLIIGIERELKKKPLGLKTSLVISIISCLITIVSIESAYVFLSNDVTEIRMDPLRLAAQIVSGIG